MAQSSVNNKYIAVKSDIYKIGIVCAIEQKMEQQTLKASLGHDLKQPLTTLRTFIRHLPDKKDDPAFMDEFYEYTEQALKRLEGLIETIEQQGVNR